jgi:hypothetical protein
LVEMLSPATTTKCPLMRKPIWHWTLTLDSM